MRYPRSKEPAPLLIHEKREVPPLFPLLPKVVPPYHRMFASLEKRCLSFEGQKRSFERILEACLCGASSLWFRTIWSLRSSLLGSNIHLTHEILNHTYPPMPLNTSSSPMEKGGRIVFHTQTLSKSFLSLWRLGEARGKDPLEGTLNTKA